MMTKSPSGALSPYYYKGGYFHGIHYGSYFGNSDALIDMMNQEEAFIMKSPERRRIMMDFYESELTPQVMERLMTQLEALKPKIMKLAFATDRKNLKCIQKAIKQRKELSSICCYFATDMEDGKTWLVGDK